MYVPQSLNMFPKQNLARLLSVITIILIEIFCLSFYSNAFGKGSNFAIFRANRRWSLQLLYYPYCDMDCMAPILSSESLVVVPIAVTTRITPSPVTGTAREFNLDQVK